MTPALRRAAVVSMALGLSGCLLRPTREPLPRPEEGDWGFAREAATRKASLYDGFDHRASAVGTHLSLPVREARARRLGEWLGWTEPELGARLATERAEAAAGEEILLSFFTSERAYNDLDAPQSTWRMALRVDGTDVLVTDVDAVGKDAALQTLFPYVGIFDTVYRLKFPPAPGGPLEGRPFVLDLSSALGHVVLDFGVPDGADTDRRQEAPPAP